MRRNRVHLSAIIDALSAMRLDKARSLVAALQVTLPRPYGQPLLTEDGQLTEFALLDSMVYPLAADVRSILGAALLGDLFAEEQLKTMGGVVSVLRLADSCGQLTDFGRLKAVESLSLTDQCSVLGIPLKELVVPPRREHDLNTVEDDVTDHFLSCGAQCLPYHYGPIFLLIRALSGFVLIERYRLSTGITTTTLIPSISLTGRGTDISDPYRADPETASAVLSAVKNGTERDVRKGFSILPASSLSGVPLGHLGDPVLAKVFKPIDEEFLVALFKALGPHRLTRLTEIFLENSMFNYQGWPDLTILQDGNVQLVEVKTTDRLMCSQIRMLPRLVQIIADVKVIRVSRIKSM